jgi:hypothetical protein
MGNNQYLGRVTLSVPDQWRDASVVTLLGPAEGKAQPSAMLVRDVYDGGDLEAFANAQAAQLRAQVAGYQEVSRGKLEGGGFRIEHKLRGQKGEEVQQIQAWRAHAKDVYILTLTHATTQFEAARPVLESVLASFRI